MNTRYFLVFFLLIVSESIYCQDTIFIYDVATQSISFRQFPISNVNAVKDSSNPSFGIYGTTPMPTVVPVDTYPGTQISLIKNSSTFYSGFNFPFTAITLVKYGLNISAAVIGRNTLLAFKFDVYDDNSLNWRNLHDCNPLFEEGTIQYGSSQLHPKKYYIVNSPGTFELEKNFAIIETEENIGDSSGYFGLAFDTSANAYDSLLLYNVMYPKEGFPNFYSDSVNGDTSMMKFGFVDDQNYFYFHAYYGGNGEYCSPFFDDQYRIWGIRWNYGDVYKLGRKGFYFLKYVNDSLTASTPEINMKPEINIYPIPVNDFLSLSFSKPLEPKCTIIISDILGREIKAIPYNIGETKLKIDVSELGKGLYLLTLSNSSFKTVSKFIKN